MLGTVWIDLDLGCIQHSARPSPIAPLAHACIPGFDIHPMLTRLGVVTYAAVDEPSFVKDMPRDW